MKMTKKKVFVVALAVCLAAIVSMGSLAWFTAQDSVSNKFYIADSEDNPDDIFSVRVYEEKDGVEYEEGIQYDDVLPGDELEKNPIVKNTGHYDQYVRVIITISDKAVWEEIVESTGTDFDLYDVRSHFTGFDSTKWDLTNSTMDNTGDSIRYVLYYKDVLAAGASFSVFTGVTIPEAMTAAHAAEFGEDGFSIDVKAQAVQTENVGTSAYAAFTTVGMAID